VSRYAEGTSVSVERSRAEVEKTLQRYDASGFGYAWDRREEVTPAKCTLGRCKDRPIADCLREHQWQVDKERREVRELVHITFKLKERVVRLDVPMPTEREAGSQAKLDAATRQRWRALVLVLKAKLEAVASGISSLESEFLANMVMKNGMTIGQAMLHRLPEVVESGRLLPPAGGAT
jgi:hypothetical protein